MKRTLTAIALSLPVLLGAQGFQVSLQGQRQQAMAGAGTAYIKDGASLFYNPGGVSFLSANSVSLGITPVFFKSTFTHTATAQQYQTTSPVSYPFTGYFTLGKKDSRLKYGLAAYTPFGSTIDWESGWTGRFVLTRIQLYAVYIQPTVSYKLSNKLGVGAGFVYSTGKVNLQQDIPIADDKGNYGNAELSSKAGGTGFNAGIYYKPDARWSLGFTYRSRVTMKSDGGEARFTVPASLASSFPNGGFRTSLPLPSVTTLGVGLQASKHLTFAADASLVGWKSFDSLEFDYEKNTPELADTKSEKNYKNAMAFRLGAQYALGQKTDLRAGIKYLGTPVQNGYLSPDVPDAAHVNYSAGVGYRFNNRFAADASITVQYMNRYGNNRETGLNGSYHTRIYMPGISFSYNF